MTLKTCNDGSFMSILYLLPSRFVRTSLAYISLRNIPRGPGAKVSNNELLNDLMATGGTGNGWKKCPFFLGNVRVVQGESRPAAAKRLLYLWAEDAWIF